MEEELIKKEPSKKKKIIVNNDENNINYYKELNSKDSTSINKSQDYYDLLKQQIKYYKELNASLKEEIETVKKCKKVKQLEDLNEINKLAQINKEKDEMNYLLSSYSDVQEKMRKELNENELKITDLQTWKKLKIIRMGSSKFLQILVIQKIARLSKQILFMGIVALMNNAI